MIFLCGRPGCGQESTATLQIDAPSSTVSLVDPRISRDGVPLCARHADATSPPLGWSMNDLRSRSRSLTAVSDDDASPRSTPPRVRPDVAAAENRSSGQRMSRRQSIEERARRDADDGIKSVPAAVNDQQDSDQAPAVAAVAAAPTGLTKKQRRVARAAQRAKERQASQGNQVIKGRAEATATTEDSRPSRKSADPESENGLASRPNRRRETEEVADEEEKFPWHHQFDDDEPDQLQASSPLLSRAFRATIG